MDEKALRIETSNGNMEVRNGSEGSRAVPETEPASASPSSTKSKISSMGDVEERARRGVNLRAPFDLLLGECPERRPNITRCRKTVFWGEFCVIQGDGVYPDGVKRKDRTIHARLCVGRMEVYTSYKQLDMCQIGECQALGMVFGLQTDLGMECSTHLQRRIGGISPVYHRPVVQFANPELQVRPRKTSNQKDHPWAKALPTENEEQEPTETQHNGDLDGIPPNWLRPSHDMAPPTAASRSSLTCNREPRYSILRRNSHQSDLDQEYENPKSLFPASNSAGSDKHSRHVECIKGVYRFNSASQGI